MKKGISLIVLVITIIVIIILAGSVILSLSKNNPINTATEATFKSTLESYNSELTMSISKRYVTNFSLDTTTLNATVWDGLGTTLGTVKEFIPSMSVDDAKNCVINEGKLVYIGTDVSKKQWAKDLGITNGLVLSLDGSDFTNAPPTVNLTDRSGNNNTAIASGFGYTASSGSNGLGSIAFDGIDDGFTSTNFMKGTDKFTFVVNIKTTQIVANPNIYDDPTICGLQQGSGATSDLVLLNRNGYLAWYDELNGSGNSLVTTKFISDGLNHNIIVTKNINVMNFYVDGVFISTLSTGLEKARNVLFLVGLKSWNGAYYQGTIKSLSVYNRPLNSTEILQVYNASL
jgi:hypothetical protein